MCQPIIIVFYCPMVIVLSVSQGRIGKADAIKFKYIRSERYLTFIVYIGLYTVTVPQVTVTVMQATVIVTQATITVPQVTPLLTCVAVQLRVVQQCLGQDEDTEIAGGGILDVLGRGRERGGVCNLHGTHCTVHIVRHTLYGTHCTAHIVRHT